MMGSPSLAGRVGQALFSLLWHLCVLSLPSKMIPLAVSNISHDDTFGNITTFVLISNQDTTTYVVTLSVILGINKPTIPPNLSLKSSEHTNVPHLDD